MAQSTFKRDIGPQNKLLWKIILFVVLDNTHIIVYKKYKIKVKI